MPSTVINFKESEHESNAVFIIAVFLDIFTVSRSVQFAKHPLPTKVSVKGSSIEVRNGQPSNAFIPIKSNPSGKLTLLRPSH